MSYYCNSKVLENLSFKLLQLYHDGHRGECDIDLALEEWVLRG